MASRVKRGVAAGGTVVFAAAVNIATGVLTQQWAVAWGAATVVLVVLGAALQVWLTVADSAAAVPPVRASAPGAIAAAGSVKNASTKVTLPAGPTRRRTRTDGTGEGGTGVVASGPGAIASGGAIDGARTEVRDGTALR